MSDSQRDLCPECGKTLPENGTHGLCPACLMGQALKSRTFDTQGDPGMAPPPAPEEIAGKFPQFEILECLGRGGMGVVYKARQKSLDRWVAIKVLAPGREDDAAFAARFEREAKTLAQMSHPNIVTVFDHGQADGLYFIVMEYVDGVNLRDLLREGKMAPEQALAIVPPVCEALEYAHGKGVVHRDIKPENLLLDREGRVKIADFGIAGLVNAAGEKSGTPPYMAPEQEKGSVDKRGDIYALGVVLYEMLTGERPTRDVVAPSRKVELDVRIDEMVLRALEKEPERRYQTAGEFRTVAETISGQGATKEVVRNHRRQNLASWTAIWFGCLSAAIPTIFYWFQPWAAPWLTPRGQEFMLNLTLVVALLAIGLGIASRKSARGPAAIIMGGISLTIWMLFFIAGQISSQGSGGGSLSSSDPFGRTYEVRGSSARLDIDGDAAVIRSGANALRFEKNRIVLDGYEVADLPFGIRAFEVMFGDEFVGVWVDGVELFEMPRDGAVTSGACAFGPVVMRMLEANSALNGSFLDFETGRVASPPKGLLAGIDTAGQLAPMLEKLAAWIRESGVDVLLRQNEGGVYLLNGRGSGFGRDFDSVEAETVRSVAETISGVRFGTPDSDPWFHMIAQTTDKAEPRVFRTREGSAGIFEIMKSAEGGAKLTLRYRIVNRRTAPLAFLPQEVVILSDPKREAAGNVLLDLDSATATGPPERTFDSETEGMRWVTEKGIDLVAERSGGRWSLVTPRTHQLLVVARFLDMKPPDLTPSIVEDLLTQVEDPGIEINDQPDREWLVYLLPEPIPPSLLLAFRTADGRTGVMRVKPVVGDKERLEIRYHLVTGG